MMKCEFEEMVGKEVSYETFEMYEAMYMACPEWVTKQDFVKMLNVDAIPESEEAIERREKRNALIAEYKAKIEKAKQEIKFFKETMDWYASLLKEGWAMMDADKDYYKREIVFYKSAIKNRKADIAQLKMLMD